MSNMMEPGIKIDLPGCSQEELRELLVLYRLCLSDEDYQKFESSLRVVLILRKEFSDNRDNKERRSSPEGLTGDGTQDW